MSVTIEIDLGKKCAECKKGGAAQSGICLGCMSKAFKQKPMKSDIGRAVQARMRAQLSGNSGEMEGR